MSPRFLPGCKNNDRWTGAGTCTFLVAGETLGQSQVAKFLGVFPGSLSLSTYSPPIYSQRPPAIQPSYLGACFSQPLVAAPSSSSCFLPGR